MRTVCAYSEAEATPDPALWTTTGNAMSDPLPSLLDKARPEDIVTDPFPHLVIEDAWPADLYDRLLATRPSFERIAWSGRMPSNKRFPYSAARILQDQEIDPVWQAFCARHAAPDIFRRVAELFRPHIDSLNPAFGRWLAEGRPRQPGLLDRDGFDRCDMLVDARLELNTPVTGAPSSVRGAHLDLPNRLFTGLFYLRKPEDDTPGGDLRLFRFRNGRPSNLTDYEIPDSLVEPVRTVPYRGNVLVLFANSPFAVHGVSARHESPHTRSYVFLTAEVENDLFG
jgi:hypothetical protein